MGDLLSEQLKIYLLRAIDYVKEEQKVRIGFGGGGAPTQVLSFSATKDVEYEAYSSDKQLDAKCSNAGQKYFGLVRSTF